MNRGSGARRYQREERDVKQDAHTRLEADIIGGYSGEPGAMEEESHKSNEK